MSKCIPWETVASVNNKKMDFHHRLIVHLINELYEKNDANRLSDIPETVAILESFIVEHFAEEERLMELIDYPEAKQHCEVHRNLLRELRKHSADYLVNGGRFPEIFFHFLRQWVVTHICGQDTKYGHYLGRKAS